MQIYWKGVNETAKNTFFVEFIGRAITDVFYEL